MAITTPTPITPSPPLPQRSDPATFENRADAYYAWQSETLPDGIDAQSEATYQNALEASQSATAADERATDAETAKGLAEDARDKSQEWADGVEPEPGAKSAREWSLVAQSWADGVEPEPGAKSSRGWAEESEVAKNSAWAAAAAAGESAGLPEPVVPGKVLGALPGGGVGWVDALRVGDVILSANPPGPNQLETGLTYLQSSYPELYAILGLRPSSLDFRAVAGAPATNLNAVARVTDSIVVAVGAGGLIIRSTDAGKTWASVASGTTDALWGVTGVASSVVVAVGRNSNNTAGVVLRSTDAGATWATVGSHPALTGVGRLTDSVIFATGLDGVLRRSADAGLTWTTPSIGTSQSLYAVCRVTDSVVVTVGDVGAIRRSVDAGLTWSGVSSPSITGTLRAAVRSTDGQLVAVGSTGTGSVAVFRSINDGASWDQVQMPIPGSLNGVVRAGASKLIAAGTNGTILQSLDAGLSWTAVSTDSSAVLNGIASLDGDTLVAVGQGGAIQRSPQYYYDTNSLFFVPRIETGVAAYRALVKA